MFHTLFYNPLYNLLILLIDFVPNNDAGLSVVLLTVLVSVVLFSISKKAIRTQIKLKEIEPELKRIKQEIKEKDVQARMMIELYKKNQVNPFSLFLFMIIQIPILFALYYIFLKGGLPEIQNDILYSFVKTPEHISMSFLGILDISQKSVFMAILASITQFIQARVATPKIVKDDKKEKTFKDDFQKSMNTQIRYVFPLLIGFISLNLPSALPLYWSTRNIFMTIQEIFVKKNLNKEKLNK